MFYRSLTAYEYLRQIVLWGVKHYFISVPPDDPHPNFQNCAMREPEQTLLSCHCCSVPRLCPTLCHPMNCSTPGFPVIKWKWSHSVAQSCPTLCNLVDCSLPGSSLHGILQARVLEWVAISFSKGSSRPRDWTRVSRIASRSFNLWATRETTPILQTKAKLDCLMCYGWKHKISTCG